MPRKYFTLSEANRTLPLVKRIVSDITALHPKWRDLVYKYELAAAQVELLFRLAPVGPRLSGSELVLVDQVAPLGMERGNVGNHSLDERQRLVGFGEGEILARHDGSYAATKGVGSGEWYLTVRAEHSVPRRNVPLPTPHGFIQ